jgi:hypothetical protein
MHQSRFDIANEQITALIARGRGGLGMGMN